MARDMMIGVDFHLWRRVWRVGVFKWTRQTGWDGRSPRNLLWSMPGQAKLLSLLPFLLPFCCKFGFFFISMLCLSWPTERPFERTNRPSGWSKDTPKCNFSFLTFIHWWVNAKGTSVNLLRLTFCTCWPLICDACHSDHQSMGSCVHVIYQAVRKNRTCFFTWYTFLHKRVPDSSACKRLLFHVFSFATLT